MPLAQRRGDRYAKSTLVLRSWVVAEPAARWFHGYDIVRPFDRADDELSVGPSR
jgi:hypothetical protein